MKTKLMMFQNKLKVKKKKTSEASLIVQYTCVIVEHIWVEHTYLPWYVLDAHGLNFFNTSEFCFCFFGHKIYLC